MVAINNGLLAIRIKTAGSVTAQGGDGIRAENQENAPTDATAHDISIEAVDVSGAERGILAFNRGTGDTLVRATGTVRGASGDGIRAIGSPVAGDLTVEANNVSGGERGINATMSGDGGIRYVDRFGLWPIAGGHLRASHGRW